MREKDMRKRNIGGNDEKTKNEVSNTPVEASLRQMPTSCW
jgi:hypothetical protein